jgi:hypothetical protein
MRANTFNVEETFKAMDREAGRKPKPATISGDYEIEATGMGEWFAYRYEFKVNERPTFGYASTIEEARDNIIKAQEAGE